MNRRRRPGADTGGYRWRAVRRAALDRDAWRCRRCGRAGVLEVDHVIPVQDGGAPYDLDNLQSLCRRCHRDKTNDERGVVPYPPDWTALVDGLLTTR